MKYNYSPEVMNVLKAYRSIRKTYSLRNACDTVENPEYASVLRRAYLTALKCDFRILLSVLSIWEASGMPMELEEKSE